MKYLVVGTGNSLSRKLIQTLSDKSNEVWSVGLRSEESKLDCKGISAHPLEINLDIHNQKSVQEVIETVKPDFIVNLVGGGSYRLLIESSENDLLDSLRLNISSASNLTNCFYSYLTEAGKKGAIVHTSSVNSISPEKGYLGYSLSKASLEAYVKASSLEMAPLLRVFGVRLGPVDTDQDSLSATLKKQSASFNLIDNRLTTGEDLGMSSIALCEYMNWSTGEIVTVDGGLILGNSKSFN